MSWFVYILEGKQRKGSALYTGISTDPERRLRAHNAGKGAKFTKGKGPWSIVYLEPVPDKGCALRRELEIKAMTRAQKLSLIVGQS